MEYLVAVLALATAIGYAVLIAVNIKKGKAWALEIARAFSMLDPGSVHYHLSQEADSSAVDKPEAVTSAAEEDRLAA